MNFINKYIVSLFIILIVNLDFAYSGYSTKKEIQYLSGTDNENTVTWDFFCTGGRKSGFWTKIDVPSQWEQQGFGSYNYGRDYYTYGREYKYADEQGLYKYTFSVPGSWSDKEIILVFEGSMTDTEVKINGSSAGEIHQGAFYRFTYNITDKLYFDKANQLEVTVSKMSSDKSVNFAERYADYWIFGGIFRPVYLEAYPTEYIERMGIAATADGLFSVDVFTKNLNNKHEIFAEILDAENNTIKSISKKIEKDNPKVTLKTQINNPSLWTSETPIVYKVNLYLKENNKTIYQTSEKFGFRTVEVRPGDGIYINDKKVKMKGINRHVFWPETGRCVNKKIDLMDVKLIKEMNMNAVRCSHYPPDQSFLDYCDSLGLYVLDELAGWHDAYDTPVGEKLVREMVIRDVNHPSIIIWSNGNEGGTNKELDDDFQKYDPSKRTVIHAHHKPGNAFNHIDTNHYESYKSMRHILQDSLIYMTTEFLHSQNDGGGGAGLSDYWELMWNSPKSAGGFIWALLDEGIVRTDLGGIIDVNGVNAPDGVLGPHREKEGSFFAIKEIFSPVHVNMEKLAETFNGNIPVENRFHFTNLIQCTFHWELVQFRKPTDPGPGYIILNKGPANASDIKPGEKGTLNLDLPANWRKADALFLKAYGPFQNEIYTWTWKIKKNEAIINSLLTTNTTCTITQNENDSLLTVKAGQISYMFDKTNGLLKEIQKERSLPLNFKNGPVLCSGNAKFKGLTHHEVNDGYFVQVNYEGDLKNAEWTFHNSGWVELNYVYTLKGSYSFSGISFDYPEERMLSIRWFGSGPYRMWKNRMQGVTQNVWEKAYNNTITGESPWLYPEFKGYYSDVTWMEFNTVEGIFLIAAKNNDLFVRLFKFYGLPGLAPQPGLPPGDISFLDYIPPVSTKMATRINSHPEKLGPASEMNTVDGTIERTLYFYFGELQ